MGKEWLHWVGGGGGSGWRSSDRRSGRSNREAAATSGGCMCAVFQIFDNFHHFHFPLNQQIASDFNQEEPTTIPKGAEAPRNSLDLDDEKAAAMDAAASRSIAMKGEENLNLPVSINHIKTKHISSSSPRVSTTKSRTIIDDYSSECCSSNLNSPGLSKTPNLVARLMGLDLLPESTSPSISRTRLKSHLHQQKFTNVFEVDIRIGSRSLPETPRISSSARRSDVEYHTHRLSLQINKENINIINDKKCLSRRGRFMRQADSQNITSPGQYAKEIVKQVKESVSRRVGLTDITNNTYNRNREIRRDENLILNKHSYKKNEITKSPRSVDSVSSDNPLQQNKDSKKDHEIITGKCSTSSSSDYIISKNKEEEAFVRLTGKKSKRSSEIMNISGPTLLQVKNDPSPPPTKLPQKQSQLVSDALSSKRSTQLSSRPSHSYKQLQIHPHKTFTVQQNDGCATATRGGAAAEYGYYIQSILKRAGIINKPTNLLTVPSHPIDPLIFHYLELFPPSAAAYGGGESSTILRHRCNRKLIFQLVDEILAEILKPHFNFKTTPNRSEDDHFPLADELCMKIDSFPAANCQDLEDIDSLIDKDLSKSSHLNGWFFEDDGESIVCEIEGDIMEWLVLETVALIGGPYGGGTDKD